MSCQMAREASATPNLKVRFKLSPPRPRLRIVRVQRQLDALAYRSQVRDTDRQNAQPRAEPLEGAGQFGLDALGKIGKPSGRETPCCSTDARVRTHVSSWFSDETECASSGERGYVTA